MLTSPYFATSTFARAPTTSLFLKRDCHKPNVHLVDVIGALGRRNFVKLQLPKMVLSSTQIVGSCNGLISFFNSFYWGNWLYVCNPITGESVAVLKPTVKLEEVYAFDFSSNTNQYKILQIVKTMVGPIGMVHTLGTRVWRSIGHAPFPLHDHLFGVPLNGALHWIVGDDNSSEYICCFDLKNEKFETFPPPPQLEKMNKSMYLGVLDFSLFK